MPYCLIYKERVFFKYIPVLSLIISSFRSTLSVMVCSIYIGITNQVLIMLNEIYLPASFITGHL